MAEIERTRERERPPIKENPYEAVLRQRAALKERNLNGPVVIRADEQETFQSRQGKLKFFMPCSTVVRPVPNVITPSSKVSASKT